MTQPLHIYRRPDLTREGSLREGAITRIRGLLGRRGYVMLPSDTAYSLAIVPRQPRHNFLTVLSRGDIPISLAFPTASSAREFVGRNRLAEALLMRYCPGPITVVVSPTGSARDLPPEWFVSSTGAYEGTIGVRVPDSMIERQVAGATAFPITTTPVLSKNGDVITDFNEAMRSVAAGIDRLPEKSRTDWIAVEGVEFHDRLSTVVRVESNRTVKCHRMGEIPYEQIVDYLDSLPPIDDDNAE